MGTAEIYRVVEQMPEITDSLVVHLEDPSGGAGELVLFVLLAEGELDDALRAKVSATLREALSPRHVADTIVAVSAVPRNLTGKKLELPVKRILQGAVPETVASREALGNPDSLDEYIAFAEARR